MEKNADLHARKAEILGAFLAAGYEVLLGQDTIEFQHRGHDHKGHIVLNLENGDATMDCYELGLIRQGADSPWWTGAEMVACLKDWMEDGEE